ncbi:hypothetical protein EUGRSUZ_J00286 [Eucalyptus grandis]|uniref:Uncharacterized protein n=2 Tax=Eucalyptus grandis TaxID=71139 RepID=A0ACC3J2T0_EUCGR|nr:hypothetical protein EUGRSUZ_J00286 [Eucalyptus grandis]
MDFIGDTSSRCPEENSGPWTKEERFQKNRDKREFTGLRRGRNHRQIVFSSMLSRVSGRLPGLNLNCRNWNVYCFCLG